MSSHEVTIPIKNLILVTISIVVIIAGGLFLISGNKSIESPKTITAKEVDGNQIIDMTAKLGFTPQNHVIKANESAILRIKTDNTFDCSSSILIPSLKVNKYLPSSGTTDIEIPAQKAGTKIKATCGMGMYSLNISVI